MSIHDKTLDQLVLRLYGYGHTMVYKNLQYRVDDIRGEFDAYVCVSNRHHRYYEVKSNLKPANVKKAEWQAYRAMIAFPYRRWKFILVTPEGVKRIKPVRHSKYYQPFSKKRRRRNYER